ncbi:conserved hypothetical protein [Methylobacterium sp. 4-46]|uniref:hypothetical protein n=1 Tax=unclassified Methylobacterium TaxID=2615210 RepID=UPI000152E459|nr:MULTISPECIES: hypothetical protein [Methylobacterium]ACA20058.1 conserved hypothetical protein [Methylobacterium sp. 4-46]WFT79245.1 hypothetical protein QA634_29125 [Methylobacterium nodulans]
MNRAWVKGALGAGALLAGLVPALADDNDYPTEARADYVFGCMAANGQTRDALQKCACSIDAIAAILPYDKYVQASTILSMRQGIGQRANEFRSTKLFDDKVAELRRAQAEAEIRCYRASVN